MQKFEIKNIIYGAETPILKLEPALLVPAQFDEFGNIVSDAVYSEAKYDTDIDLPEIKDGDEAYYVTATVFIKSNNINIPDFQSVIRIVSLNSMTGFEVDSQREKFIADYIESINK